MQRLAILPRNLTYACRPLSCACWLGVLLLGFGATPTFAQSPPPSLDGQLREQLALGDSQGCVNFLRVTDEDAVNAGGIQTAVNRRLTELGPGQIGNELRAICGPSAVGSASSLGGALNSVQATKTVSQFRQVRRRIDRRIHPRGETRQASLMLMFQPSQIVPDGELWRDSEPGVAFFGEIEYERRRQDTTYYEQGYEADVGDASFGVDYVWNRGIVGAWVGYSRNDADLRDATPQAFFLAGRTDDDFNRLLSDPATSSGICGGILPGGDFRLEGGRLGAYAGWRSGGGAFVDIAASRSRGDYNYTKGTCVIEAQNAENLRYDGILLFNDGNGDGIFSEDNNSGDSRVDDIFAGRISGDTKSTVYSASIRTGFDLTSGNWSFGPRAILTYSRNRIDAYAETGSSTVANPVTPGAGDERVTVNRTLGGPIGLELAYHEQTDYSLLLEMGGLVERVFELSGKYVVAHASAYWRHQFRDDRHFATVRFAQDYRADPVMFSFAGNEIDADNALLSIGVTAPIGRRAAIRFEASHLAFDSLIDSTAFSIQFRAGL